MRPHALLQSLAVAGSAGPDLGIALVLKGLECATPAGSYVGILVLAGNKAGGPFQVQPEGKALACLPLVVARFEQVGTCPAAGA